MKPGALALGFGHLRPDDVPRNQGDTGHCRNSLKEGANSYRGYTPVNSIQLGGQLEANVVWVSHDEHAQFVKYWNNLYCSGK